MYYYYSMICCSFFSSQMISCNEVFLSRVGKVKYIKLDLCIWLNNEIGILKEIHNTCSSSIRVY